MVFAVSFIGLGYFGISQVEFKHDPRDGRYKLISRQTSTQVELYDLHHDPEERTDIAPTSDLLLRSMTERLRMWEEETRMCAERYWPEDVHDEAVDVQPEVVERLRDLGYVE